MNTADIAHRFSAGARFYESEATLQKQVALRFMAWLHDNAQQQSPRPSKPSRILELGCGTGFVTGELRRRHPDASIHVCDISADMLQTCRRHTGESVIFHQADAGQFALPAHHAPDWIISSFCLQWMSDLPRTLRFHAQQARKRLAICIPCSGSFPDWQEIHRLQGLTPALWPLPSAQMVLETLRENAGQSRKARIDATQIELTQSHDSPLAFARHLRRIGADTGAGAGAGIALRRVLEQLPSPYAARYEVLMVDVSFEESTTGILKVNQNAEPLPGSLVTPASPPI